MATNTNNDTIVSTTTKRLAAIAKYLTNPATEIAAGGNLVKPADIAAVFQKSLDAHGAVDDARAKYHSALAVRHAADAERRVFDEALKSWVLNRFGATSTEAQAFGYQPRKVGQKTAETKANAVQLNKATRKARGTMGKKEKSKIKGTLPAPTVPAAPAPSATPAVVHVVTAAPTPAEGGAQNGAAHA